MDENDTNDTPDFEQSSDAPEESGSENNGTQQPSGDHVDANAALQAAIKKYKVKVDGEELDVDEDELLRGYQTTKAAQKRMSEAALMRQQAEELVKLAKQDPRKLLSHPSINHDMRAFAEAILAEYMEEELMDPKDKELRDTKKRLAEFENEQKAKKEAAEAEQKQKLYEHYEADISTKIGAALDTSGLPKTESTVKRMAQYMMMALEQNLDVEPKDVVELVRADYMNDVKSLFGSAPEDIMLQMLGDDLTNKAVKAHLKKTQKAAPVVKRVAPSEQATPDGRERGNQSKPLSRSEWKKVMAEKRKNV